MAAAGIGKEEKERGKERKEIGGYIRFISINIIQLPSGACRARKRWKRRKEEKRRRREGREKKKETTI